MASLNMRSHAPLSSTNDHLFGDYLASSNHQEGICIGAAPQNSNLDQSMIGDNYLTTIAKESSMLLSEESKLKVLYDAVWKYGSDAWGHNAQTAEAPLNQSAYSSGQQYYFDSLPTSSEFGDSKEKSDYYLGFIDPSLLSDPSSSPVFAGEFDAGESDTGIKDTARGAIGSYDVLQKNSKFPLLSEHKGYITSNNIERSKRVPVEGLSTMLVVPYQFPHVLELKNSISCKEELPTSSGGTQRVSLETEAPSINDRRRIECQFPDCNKKKGFKNMQTYIIHMRKHQECSTKGPPAYPSQVSDIDLANPGVPLPYVIPPPVKMEDKVFRCPYAGCKLTPFKSINTFRRHCDSVHSGKEAECPFCMLERSDRKDEDNSKKVHLFTRADALQKHLKRMHPVIEKNDPRVLEVMRILRRGNGKGVIWDKTTEPAGKGFEGRDENGILIGDSITQKRKRTKACKDQSQKLKKAKLQNGPSKEECELGKVKEEETISPQPSLSLSGHYYSSFNSSGSFSSFLDSSSSPFPSTNGSTEVVVPLRKRQRTSTAAPGKGKTRAKVSKLKREADSDEEKISAKRSKYFHASDILFETTGVVGLGEATKKEDVPGFLGLGKEVVGQNVALKSKVPESAAAGSASSFGYCFCWPDDGASFNHNAGGHQIQSSDTPASAVTNPALWNNWATENVVDTDTWRPDCPQQISRGETNLPVSIQSAKVREFTGNHVENPTAIAEEHGMLVMEEENYININNSGASLASSSSMISQNEVSGSYNQRPHQVHVFGLPAEPTSESQYTDWLSYMLNDSLVPME